jgi:6-phosphofructokinase 1
MSSRIKDNLAMHAVDCLVVIGGDATIRYAAKLAEKGIQIVAIPKTVENDIYGTDISFGFMTAVNTATKAIDKLHSTAESHHRVMILEVMGLISGWIALESGIAGGADVILIPEIPFDINKIARAIFERKNAGKGFSIIVAAAGAEAKLKSGSAKKKIVHDTSYYHEGECSTLAVELEKLTSIEHRITVLGYLQRGGEPCPADRILATRFGASAVKVVEKGEYNRMVCVNNQQIKSVPLEEVAGKARTVTESEELVSIARDMGVCFGD